MFRFFSTLRIRLILLLLLALLPALGLILFMAAAQRGNARSQAAGDALDLARSISASQDDQIIGSEQLLIALAQFLPDSTQDSAVCNALLMEMLPRYPSYTNFWVSRRDGTEYCSAKPAGLNLNNRDLGWFQRARDGAGFTVGEYQIGPVSGKPILVMAYPVIINGRVERVIATALELSWLTQSLAKLHLPLGTVATVLDRNGVVLAREPDAGGLIGLTTAENEVTKRQIAQSEGVLEAWGLDGVRRVYGFTSLGSASSGVSVRVGIPTTAAYAQANRVLAWSLAGFVVATLFMASAAWLGADLFLLRQVRRLVVTANRLRTGNLGARVLLPKAAGELGELGAAINAMAASLEERQGQLSQQRDAARQAEAQRHANEIRLGRIIETMADGLLIVDSEGRVTLVNSAAARMLRLRENDLIGRSVFSSAWRRLRPDGSTMPKEDSPFERVIAARQPISGVEMLVIHPDGDRSILSVNAAPLLNADGTLLNVISNFTDISSLKATEQALRYSEQRFRSLVQHASDLVLVVEPDGIISYVSPSVERILGQPPSDLIGASIFAQVHPDDLLAVQRSLTDGIVLSQGQRVSQYRLRRRTGEWCALEVVGTNLRDDPAVAGYVLNARDVTDRQALEAELARQSLYDTLTGLPNRRLLSDRLALALARVSRRNSALAVLFLGVDGFKLINDSLGHAAGDALLVALGKRLAGCLRDEDTIARFGGDEFVMLLEHMHNPADVDRTAERILRSLTAPLLVEGHEVVVNASIGITLSGSQLQTPDDILRQADIALYQAKIAGKSRAKWFDAGMGTRALERLDLDCDLRQAVNRNELVLHYQPEVNLRTGIVTGVEALLRWQHPTRGLISPDAFIPIAEETGLILPIGQWVLAEACRQARRWELLRPDGPPLVMSVNVSPREFEQPELVARVVRVLAETGVSPSSLCLEITESTLMGNADATRDVLAALRKLGVRVAIDDFGTGYSSLSYLQRFAVDTLKIDRSFIHKLPEDTGTFAIIKAVTSVAHALGMAVTAEGIETMTQVGETRRLLCDVGQGFHFSRPAPPDALAALLHPGYRAIMTPATS